MFVSVYSILWFDNGYIFGVSLWSLLEEFPSYFNALLKFMRQITEAGFSGFDTPRTVFLPCLQARDARHHGQYGPEG